MSLGTIYKNQKTINENIERSLRIPEIKQAIKDIRSLSKKIEELIKPNNRSVIKKIKEKIEKITHSNNKIHSENTNIKKNDNLELLKKLQFILGRHKEFLKTTQSTTQDGTRLSVNQSEFLDKIIKDIEKFQKDIDQYRKNPSFTEESKNYIEQVHQIEDLNAFNILDPRKFDLSKISQPHEPKQK